MAYQKITGFPSDFLWGASSSAFQVEGGYDEGGKGLSVADTASFAHADKYADTKVAADFYHRYKEDIALMAELGLKSYRFSISWSRLFPNGDDAQPKAAGLAFYCDVLDELKKYGIEPIVTLYHFDLPQSLQDRFGGWADRRTIDAFVRYAEACFKAFGGDIRYWLTINEQNLMVRKGGLIQITETDPVKREKIRHQMNHHMFLANARAIKLCHEMCPEAKIGPTFAYLPSYPATCKPEDMMAALEADNYYNYYLTDVYVFGKYPEYYLRFLEEQGAVPEIAPEDEAILTGATPDFIGFNYYLTYAAEYCPKDVKGDYVHLLKLVVPGHFRFVDNPYLKASEYGWQIDPVGFRRALMELYQRYHLPLMVTENGLGTHDVLSEDGKVHDQYRIDYLDSHLREMKKAVCDGVPLISYNTWTFMDVVSSSDGFQKRYGLVYVNREELDQKDMRRIKKDSYDYYRHVIETNGTEL